MTANEPKRPSTARKVTNDYKRKQDAVLDDGIKITIDGTVYEVRDGDVTAQAARELRAVSGMSYVSLQRLINNDPDIDVLSTFVWFARRVLGEQVSFDEVSVTYAQILEDDFDITQPDAEVLDTSNPEG